MVPDLSREIKSELQMSEKIRARTVVLAGTLSYYVIRVAPMKLLVLISIYSIKHNKMINFTQKI